MREEWRPIEGYEGIYEVSNTWKARSIDRYDSRGVFRKGVELKIRTYEGERFARLSKNGRVRDLSLDRIVYSTFFQKKNEA